MLTNLKKNKVQSKGGIVVDSDVRFCNTLHQKIVEEQFFNKRIFYNSAAKEKDIRSLFISYLVESKKRGLAVKFTNILRAAFMYLQIVFEFFCKVNHPKSCSKMLVKLTCRMEAANFNT